MPSQNSGSLLARNPVFRQFIVAITVSLLGSCIFDIAMPLYVLQKTNSGFYMSMVTFALNLPYFLMAPLTGFFADAADKRKVMLVSDAGQVFFLTLLIAYELFSGEKLWPLLVLVFIIKTLVIVYENISTFQLIPALVGHDDLSSANTWYLGAQRSIQVIGPLIAGIVLSVIGIKTCIMLNILSFVATAYFTWKLKNMNELIHSGVDVPHHKPLTVGHMVDNFLTSIKWVWASTIFRPLVLLMFFWNLSSLLPNSPSVTYFFTATHQYSSAKYGLVCSLVGVLAVMGYLISSALFKFYDFRVVMVASSLWQAALGTLAVCLYWHPVGLAITFAVSRMGSSSLNMGTFVLRQTKVPRSKMGGVNACMRMFFMAAAPVSALMQAFLIEYTGVFLSLTLGAVALWVTVFFSDKVAVAVGEKAKIPNKAA